MAGDRIADALRRVHSTELANTSIEVYEPTTTYSQGDGWTVSYPDLPNAAYDARIDSPSADSDRDRSGTTSEIDVIVRVRDDTGQQWTGWGEETEAPVRIRDAADQTMYEVQDDIDQHNGTIELEAVGV
ncbi:hypothetical protein SAMN06269185_3276 [Natronoarchaeum philippinense]|uniref:Uncharacterized protein n=1 Tax=Natronoarchaeum philippinense TaxID=558529 RepID=A0A285P8U0_NATPI|nr:hypothetical protein [Natronoarchaeum philippinense]SNZ18169.1 hypothetical protein SAMN06269185_3276 [Natronoarchaeum philippinense]